MSAEVLNRKVTTLSDEISFMPILILNIHENCNCKCRMCDIWKRPAGKEISLDQIRRYQDSIRSLGVQQVVLTGGEPLLHSRFGDLCRMLKECSIKLTLLTSGLLLEKRADVIVEYVDEIIVSLDGPEAIHNAIRGISRAYHILDSGIASIKQKRPSMPIRARNTVQKSNFRHMRQTVAAAKQLRCDSISFLAVDTYSHAFNRELIWPIERQNEIGISINDIDELENEVDLLIDQYASDIEDHYIAERPDKLRRIARYFRQCLGQILPTSPICNAPWISTVVEVDGSVRPCFFHSEIGDTTVITLSEAINSTSALHFRQTLDIDANSICQRCVCSLNYQL